MDLNLGPMAPEATALPIVLFSICIIEIVMRKKQK